MSRLTLIKGSCADQNVDAVVNAANRGLWAGGGICGVIFSKCGMSELAEACEKYDTPLCDGAAVITPAFRMTNAKYIIHAVGPDFDLTPTAFEALFDAYFNSLCVLKENNLHSISFPLISSGIFGGNLPDPVGESTKQCILAYKKFTADYPDYDVDVLLCAFTDSSMTDARIVFDNMI
ncbi:MAG: macro domain-containing protein [Clostridia bacterium]|nr:macro domain-containing protein [Clostridia bacterium]